MRARPSPIQARQRADAAPASPGHEQQKEVAPSARQHSSSSLSFFSSPTSIAYNISSTLLFTSQEKVGRGPSSSARISTATIATHTGCGN
uniref:Uncharacterized protein n=1 Tax=Zea mays TaxID=4577 RepID=A0A804R485_MAIZE